MAEYPWFSEFSRAIANFFSFSNSIVCFKYKQQLNTWAKTYIPFNQTKFRQYINCPPDYLVSEVSRLVPVSLAERVGRELVLQPNDSGTCLSTYEYINVYGKHSYDSDMLMLGDNDVLFGVNSDAPEDFINRFEHRLMVQHHGHCPFLAVVSRDCINVAVSIVAKSSKLIEVNVGVSLTNESHLRIITNDAPDSQFDKAMAMYQILDATRHNEKNK